MTDAVAPLVQPVPGHPPNGHAEAVVVADARVPATATAA